MIQLFSFPAGFLLIICCIGGRIIEGVLHFLNCFNVPDFAFTQSTIASWLIFGFLKKGICPCWGFYYFFNWIHMLGGRRVQDLLFCHLADSTPQFFKNINQILSMAWNTFPNYISVGSANLPLINCVLIPWVLQLLRELRLCFWYQDLYKEWPFGMVNTWLLFFSHFQVISLFVQIYLNIFPFYSSFHMLIEFYSFFSRAQPNLYNPYF